MIYLKNEVHKTSQKQLKLDVINSLTAPTLVGCWNQDLFMSWKGYAVTLFQ